MMDKTEKTETYAYGSKVRITDALLIDGVKSSKALFEDPIVLPELGEPRPSAVEFYTESPYEAGNYEEVKDKREFWTYDYKYATRNNNREMLEENQPMIRRRKYYWHKEVKLKEFKENQVDSMRHRIRPMKPNVESDLQPTFWFRVYFEQLDRKQLEQLKWALDFGNIECAHKLGRGKPLGFGSVQIIVRRLQLREIDEENGEWKITTIGDGDGLNYDEFFGKSGFEPDKIPESLKLMSNWRHKPTNVHYPMGADKKAHSTENTNASHQWFRLNKEAISFKHSFSKVLPSAVEDANKKLAQKKALYKLINKEK